MVDLSRHGIQTSDIMILAIQKCAFIVSTKGKAVFVDVEMCREASKMMLFTKVQYFYAKEKEIFRELYFLFAAVC